MESRVTISEMDSAVRAVVRQIVDEFEPLRIILFGSRAQGTEQPDSDVDLLVVMPDGTDPREAMVQIGSRIERTDCGIDILVTTPALLNAQAGNPGLIYGHIVQTGRDVYFAPGFQTSEPGSEYSAGDSGSPRA